MPRRSKSKALHSPVSDTVLRRGVLRVLLAAALGAFAGCATVSAVDRARVETGGKVVEARLGCAHREPLAFTPGHLDSGRPLAVVSWNIHKNADPGWQDDLARFASGSDLVLLQEASLTDELRGVLGKSARHWVHADAWEYEGVANGVLTGAAVAPYDACLQRAVEPLITLPKSALVAWYRVAGRTETLAVANLHAINFTLALGAYREQLDALGTVLDSHRGPMIVAGDFNTWSVYRVEAVHAFATRLALSEVKASRGERTVFSGMPVDYLFVRGFDVVDAWVDEVASSDHSPILATLRWERR